MQLIMLVNRLQNRKITTETVTNNSTETVTNNYNHYNEDVNLSKSNEMIASFLKPLITTFNFLIGCFKLLYKRVGGE